MSLFGSITHAVAHTASSVADKAVHTVQDLGHGVDHLIHHPVSSVRDAARGVAHIATKSAKAVASGAHALATDPKKALSDAGKWAWHNKAQIGFWVGTVALAAAIPLTGGASEALEGGLIAARAASLAAKAGEVVEAGSSAARVAEGGSALARVAEGGAEVSKAASGGSRVAKLAEGGSNAAKLGEGGAKAAPTVGRLKAARIAYGKQGLTGGKALLKAQKPLANVSTAIGVANVTDESIKLARGKGNVKNLALSTVGLLPLGGKLVGKLATRKAETVATNIVEDTAAKLTTAESRTVTAQAKANEAVRLAPAGEATDATRSATSTIDASVGAARNVRATAESSLDTGALGSPTKVAELQRKVVDMRATTARALDDLGSARVRLPGQADEVASSAVHDLSTAHQIADEAEQNLAWAVDKTSSLARTASTAKVAERRLGTTGSTAGIVNSAHNIADAHSHNRAGSSMDESAIGRLLVGMFLSHNAR